MKTILAAILLMGTMVSCDSEARDWSVNGFLKSSHTETTRRVCVYRAGGDLYKVYMPLTKACPSVLKIKLDKFN